LAALSRCSAVAAAALAVAHQIPLADSLNLITQTGPVDLASRSERMFKP